MSRDLKIDGLKFIMIYCVVLGHLVYNDYGLLLNQIIYVFHMPVFIFVSGYVTSLKSDTKHHLHWLKKTLIVYFIAQILHLLYSYIHGYHFTIYNLFHPAIAMWYIVCLIIWRFAIWSIFKKTDDKLLFIISIVLAFFAGFVPIDDDISFQRAFSFFPFFVMGVIFKKRKLMERLEQIPMSYAVIALLVCAIAGRLFPQYYMPHLHYTDWNDPITRIFQTSIAFIACLAVVRLSRVDFTKHFARFGQYTLWVFIGHTFLVRENFLENFLDDHFGYELNIFEAQIVCIVYCFIFIGLAMLYHRIFDKKCSEHNN